MSENWLEIDEAAKRSGLHKGYIVRMCGDEKRAPAAGTLLSRGMAKLEKPAGGGKARWLVREDADERFARVKFAEQIGTDLSAFTSAQRTVALRRRSILQRWGEAVKAGLTLGIGREKATGQFLNQLIITGEADLSRATLYNWDNSFRADGLVGLVDGRGKNAAEKVEADDPFLAEVQKLWLTTKRRKIAYCHELVIDIAQQHGWTARTYAACKRHLAKIPAAVVYKMRGGEEAYINHAAPFIERDYTTLEANQLWNADHHQFDVLVSVSERLDSETGEIVKRHLRPWVTAFQDCRSRKIVGWKVFAHDPNSDTILSVFRKAVIDNGAPRELLIDNGKDFESKDLTGRTKKDRQRKRNLRVELSEHARGVFPALEIRLHHAKPYHGQSKPLERWFGFVESRTVDWSTYCGNKPENRPSARLDKDDVTLAIERGQAPTIEEFADWFDAWVIAYNAGHEHSGHGMDGKTPDAIFAQTLLTKRVVDRRLLDVLCLRRIAGVGSGEKFRPLRVQQNGITHNRLRYGQFEPAVTRLLGQPIVIRVDDEDLSTVQVYTSDDVFICLAPCNSRIGVNANSQILREALNSQRADRQIFKKYIERRPHMTEDHSERMLRAARAKAAVAAATTPRPDPTLKPVRHALESQLDAIQNASERHSNPMKIAVGAESMSDESALPSQFAYASQEAVETSGEESTLDSFADYSARRRSEEDSDE